MESPTTRRNAADVLFPRMDGLLQHAFVVCYNTYGKIATKKLISCFVDPTAVTVAQRVVSSLDGAYDIPPAPSQNITMSTEPSHHEDAPSWLATMPIGPGISPCVHNTCLKLIQNESGEVVDTLAFFECLCDTACELCRVIQSKQLNVSAIVAQESSID